jgi:hypothetical protein
MTEAERTEIRERLARVSRIIRNAASVMVVRADREALLEVPCDIGRLLDEVERLTEARLKLAEDNGRLRAQVGQVTEEQERVVLFTKGCVARGGELLAENARLREAVRRLVSAMNIGIDAHDKTSMLYARALQEPLLRDPLIRDCLMNHPAQEVRSDS